SLLGRSEAEREALRIYGRELGLAFQLIDDVLDYGGDAAAMGKNVGDDLAEGKPTLPLIHAMATGNDEQRKLVRAAIRKGALENMSDVLAVVHELRPIEYAPEQAVACANRGRAQLEQ